MDKKNKQKELQNQQTIYQQNIQSLGYNIVTCGDCGSTIICKLNDTIIQCPDCLFESEPCDFPDLNY